MTTMEQELIVSKLRWEQARSQWLDALGTLNIAVEAAVGSGMNQSEVARVLGWPRQRVSKLLADLSHE